MFQNRIKKDKIPATFTESRIKPLALIIISFIISRLIFFCVGIRFDAAIPLAEYWQYIDPQLLKNNLFQSVYYLHSQPPLFNLFLGSVLKLFPDTYTTLIFNFTYLIFGLVLVSSIFLIMTKLGVSHRLSGILTILFIFSPSSILYENWLFYTYPVITLFCLSTLFLHRFLMKKSLMDGTIFFMILASIALIRCVFHIAWFLLFVIMLLFYQRDNWRKVILASCIPFMLVFTLYAKNLYIFGNFGASSWLGLNFSRITTFSLSGNTRKLLVEEGKISELALMSICEPVSAHQNYLQKTQKTNIPVLDQQLKSTGANNYNNLAYIDISRQYLKDAMYILTRYPKVYLRQLKHSYSIFFFPSTTNPFLDGNRKHIQGLDTFYNVVFYGQFSPFYRIISRTMAEGGVIDYYTKKILEMGLFLIAAFFVAILYGLRLLLNALLQKPRNLPFALTILFLWINIIFVTVVCNSLEIGENQRFRFMIDPFILIFLGLFLNHVFIKCIDKKSIDESFNPLKVLGWPTL